MPLYRLKIPQDSVNPQQRAAIAKSFTDIHCDSTNAPRNFVHVFFDEHPESESPWPARYYMDGINRAGRPQEVTDRLLHDLLESFAAHSGLPRDQIAGRIGVTPASWVMEGGAVLPEPGQEGAEWYAHAAAD